MKNINKTEIRKLIKEVLQERWSDILFSPEETPRGQHESYSLYPNLDNWANDMLDNENRYIGPKLKGFDYRVGDVVFPKKEDWEKSEADEKHEKTALYVVTQKWNQLFGKLHNIPQSKIDTFNESVRIRYERDYVTIY